MAKNADKLIWAVTIVLALGILGGAIYISKQRSVLQPTEPVVLQPEERIEQPTPVKADKPKEMKAPDVTAPSDTPIERPALTVKKEDEKETGTLVALLDGLEFTIDLTGGAFEAGRRLPLEYTCYRSNSSPPLKWSDVPKGAKSLVFVLAMQKKEALPRVHWVLFNVPPDTLHLPYAVPKELVWKNDARQALNDFGSVGYAGPCDPKGRFSYNFYIFALDTKLDTGDETARVDNGEIFSAMEGHVLAAGRMYMQHYLRQ